MELKRKVNYTESFKASKKSRIIIEALQGEIKKSDIYNNCIENYGLTLAFGTLNVEKFSELREKIKEIEKEKLA